ncbi:ABC-2 type transport system permease protein [Brevibacterium sanguinis]|uniref:Transport permease protein n=2 Tax=Brevibacterium TaxID=1696 RepID=A0A366IQN0_9MICO|nr:MULTISPECIES: ABC transporter permease [Brevibacterium]RBP67932.1 ABC-2 type transport system permease protein [Brevibacterium sanguinis]RBP74651.1 ABC-2 type transport system permease protein [Brevibacterium celere]
MNRTIATSRRVLAQVVHDRRTLALLLIVPALLIGLVAWIFTETPVFDRIAGQLIAMFPFVTMFLVTSIATLRERRSGTLERLLTMPLSKADFILGYALAFGLLALVQSIICVSWAVLVCGFDPGDHLVVFVATTMLNGILGTAFGLFASAFAATEFQAVQFMPAFVFPQILLAGLFLPTDQLPRALEILAHLMPMTYAFDALTEVTAAAPDLRAVAVDDAVLGGFVVLLLTLGSLSLRRRSR